ncbi:hypothetical protein ES708_02968 [subsurface metagenome]
MTVKTNKLAVPDAIITSKIYLIRYKKVMLDEDLAELYGVTTGNLNKAVKRNIARFPEDFMFQLTKEEFDNLIFQIGTSGWGGRRKLPYAFTKIMLIFEYLKQLEQTKQEELEQEPRKVIEGYRKEKRSKKS